MLFVFDVFISASWKRLFECDTYSVVGFLLCLSYATFYSVGNEEQGNEYGVICFVMFLSSVIIPTCPFMLAILTMTHSELSVFHVLYDFLFIYIFYATLFFPFSPNGVLQTLPHSP